MSPKRTPENAIAVYEDAGHSLTLSDLTEAEKWAFVGGILPIAWKATKSGAPVGALTIDGVRVTEQHVAKQAGGKPKTARNAMDKLRERGVLYDDAETGCERVRHFEEWNPSPKPRRRDRTATRRQRLARDPQLRMAIRDRDHGRCRYCGLEVRFEDRRGAHGGTYDHVDPHGENTMQNVVVACRTCNARKGCRTPEEAGMLLLPVPRDGVHINDGSRSGSKSEPSPVLDPSPSSRSLPPDPHPSPSNPSSPPLGGAPAREPAELGDQAPTWAEEARDQVLAVWRDIPASSPASRLNPADPFGVEQAIVRHPGRSYVDAARAVIVRASDAGQRFTNAAVLLGDELERQASGGARGAGRPPAAKPAKTKPWDGALAAARSQSGGAA